MTTSNTTAKILLAVVFLSTLSQTKLVYGCLVWRNNGCAECYRRQLSKADGCGRLLPDTDTCLIHTEQVGKPVQCATCKPGYAFDVAGNCVKADIKNCVVAFKNGGKAQCFACTNDEYPTALTPGATCKQVPEAQRVPHCDWGTSYNPGNYACLKCKDGFMVDKYKRVCIPQTISGCFQANDGKCTLCDYTKGFSMQPDGKCVNTDN